MRSFLVVILAAILGVATGVSIAALRIAMAPWDGDPGGAGLGTQAVDRSAGPTPKVVVEQEKYEFGMMDANAEASHEFIFTNRGDATLELTPGETSCGCTVSEIGAERIAPGESGRVTVKWTGDKGEGPFELTAAIETNDPARPRVTLTVSGVITMVVRPDPARLVLGPVPAGRPVTAEVRLLCYLPQPLEVSGYELVDEPSSEYFEVTFEPLPADQLVEAQAEGQNPGEGEKTGSGAKLRGQGKPRSGCLLKVTLKPGLPLGGFHQTISVRTTLTSHPTVKIPVEGTIVGDISIVGGPEWDDENSLLSLGTVSGQEGAEHTLRLVARGPHAKEVHFTLVRTTPDLLQVDQQKLKQTTAIGRGTVTQTPLVIRIPKGSRRASYLGPEFGEILIKTNHPEVPQLRIRVRFAVKG